MSHGFDKGQVLIAFAPGKRNPERMWPLWKFIELGNWLKMTYKCRFLVLGGKGEEHLGQELRNQIGDTVIDRIGKLTLRQSYALLRHVCLYIGNDTGPKHMAAAAGVPIIEINAYPLGGYAMHTYSPSRFGPWGVPAVVIQPTISKNSCNAVPDNGIEGISVEDVKKAVLQILETNKEHHSVTYGC
jgi:ADP-heptose:LPS heptosyltransferase